SMATEIGTLYNDEMLSQLLAAKIQDQETIVISDFDGTLFHKDDPVRTQRCMEAFMSYPKRIVCSARSISDLLKAFDYHGLKVDWVVGYSGSVVADGYGNPLWFTSFEEKEIANLEKILISSERIEMEGNLLQFAVPLENAPNI